ncbi:uncharacterized protein LDX57_007828 [Aspergillus melleus]|uniref:uncharacterized protein n=1 Tax=Aspergillus melleus TaxID=138277 RepID=UPI001E8DC460|nr:uncharacterized protein LDX57_007828 [Aspergillus melleus]KAH8430158.1 hypothetical protein LDX57_007828 [Aspergillus melleus]
MSMLTRLPLELRCMVGELLDERTLYALCLTCHDMQSTFAKVLFKRNIAINNSSGLHWAVQHDRRDIANIFLSYGANVNAIENGDSLLWCAVRCQAMDTIELLLNHHDIDINGCDDQGRSILWYVL